MAREVTLEFKDKDLRKFLNDIIKNEKSVRGRSKEFIAALSAPVFGDIVSHFEKEMGPKGSWTPWSLSYMEVITGRAAFRTFGGRVVRIEANPNSSGFAGTIKPLKPKPGAILQWKGKLRQSITPKQHGGRAKSPRRGSKGILFFSTIKYSRRHDQGDPGGRPMPARPFMWLSQKGVEKVSRVSLGFLLGGKKGMHRTCANFNLLD